MLAKPKQLTQMEKVGALLAVAGALTSFASLLAPWAVISAEIPGLGEGRVSFYLFSGVKASIAWAGELGTRSPEVSLTHISRVFWIPTVLVLFQVISTLAGGELPLLSGLSCIICGVAISLVIGDYIERELWGILGTMESMGFRIAVMSPGGLIMALSGFMLVLSWWLRRARPRNQF